MTMLIFRLNAVVITVNCIQSLRVLVLETSSIRLFLMQFINIASILFVKSSLAEFRAII